jgi:uncharacterized protein (DUF58 family)
VATPFAGVARDRLDSGLRGDPVVEGTVGAEPFGYGVEYADRGEWTIGPVRITARDVLGLLERELVASGQKRVLVYPQVRELSGAARHDLRRLYDVERARERDEFDRLREYERGDALRDVNWKSSAKREELVVTEFATQSRTRAVSVSAGSRLGYGDEMAEATASICAALVDVGVPVSLTTPSGDVETRRGGFTRLLEHLARIDGGEPPESDADVTVYATSSGTTVRVGGIETSFRALLEGPLGAGGGGDDAGPAPEVSP